MNKWHHPGTADPTLRMAVCYNCHTFYEMASGDTPFDCLVCHAHLVHPSTPA